MPEASADYLLVASRYNQHVWLLRWSDGAWRITEEVEAFSGLPCSTSAHFEDGLPTDIYSYGELGAYVTFYSNLLEKWVVSYDSEDGVGNALEGGATGYPWTYGNIALPEQLYQWIQERAMKILDDGRIRQTRPLTVRVLLF